MSFTIVKTVRRVMPLAFLLLAACSGGGDSSTSAPTSTVVGTQMGGARQGVTLSLASNPATVTTLAGVSVLNTAADGVGPAATFKTPQGAVADGAGNLYVADTGNHTIRKIVAATGEVTTVAGQAGTPGAADGTGTAASFNNPAGLATDGSSLYVADWINNKIRKITPASGTLAAMTAANAVVTSYTGAANTAMGQGAADGAAASATFNQPFGIVMDSTHANLYVADSGNNKIRKIALGNGTVSSLTGAANAVVTLGAADSTTATNVSFDRPVNIAIDSSDTNLYVVDTGNNKIRQVVVGSGATSSLTGAASAVVTAGAADSTTPANVAFNEPSGIVIDSTDSNLYVADSGNHKVRKVALTGTPGATSSYTGTADTTMTVGHADGAAAAVTFTYPQGLATDGTALYIADTYNHIIRKITLSGGQASTLAGLGPKEYPDGVGQGARLDWNSMGTTDGVNLYVTECGSVYTRVRKVEIASGKVTTLAGDTEWSSKDGTGLAATFNCPGGITTDGNALYVVDNGSNLLRKIVPASGALKDMTSANAVVTTLAGAGTYITTDGTGLAATFKGPWGITTDGSALYVVEFDSATVRKVMPASGTLSAMSSANAVVTTLAGTGAGGYLDATGTQAQFNGPNGITTDGKALYVAEYYNYAIRKIAPSSGSLAAMVSATAVVTTLAGTGAAGVADGVASAASFYIPTDITTDGTNLYVDDSYNNKIRMIAPTNGATLSTMTSATATVSSITGTANTVSAIGYADGAAASATFNTYSQSITTDGISLFVSDFTSGTIRKIQ